MKAGQKVAVQPLQIASKHPGIRFDRAQGAAMLLAPRGASGQVLQVAPDGKECLVELYWNDSGRPGAGHTWRIWVKREWFGQLLGI